MSLTSVAIIGSGNIGTDLMMKINQHSESLKVAVIVGIDPDSSGLAKAQSMGVETTHEGIEGLLRSEQFNEVEIVFDATSAKAHQLHHKTLESHNIMLIDLTPAAIGPFVIPSVNLEQHLADDCNNLNMVTCGGQATIPIVAAISEVVPVAYAEIVASISSRSAGPGTRANIDEFTQTTARGIEIVGGAEKGKAIIVLNPAEPPILMRNTVFCFVPGNINTSQVESNIQKMVSIVSSYVPGYRLKQEIQFDPVESLTIPGQLEAVSGTKITTFLEIEGAGDFLPEYAGNLDIMTSAAMATAEKIVSIRKDQTASGASS